MIISETSGTAPVGMHESMQSSLHTRTHAHTSHQIHQALVYVKEQSPKSAEYATEFRCGRVGGAAVWVCDKLPNATCR